MADEASGREMRGEYGERRPWLASAGPSDVDPPDTLSGPALDEARWLSLRLRARSPAATALAERLSDLVQADEASRRGNQRRVIGRTKLTRAVAAIAGAVLQAWFRRGGPRAVCRSNKAESFTGLPVGRQTFALVVGFLIRQGYLRTRRGWHPRVEPGLDVVEPLGRCARYWPARALLELAQAAGLTPHRLGRAFVPDAPATVSRSAEPVVLRPLKRRPGEGASAPPRLLACRQDREVDEIRRDVEAQNALARRTCVTGCAPPLLSRLILGGIGLHGRWYAAGHEEPYERMSRAARSRITLDGVPVVELDVRASHLTIVRGLAYRHGLGEAAVWNDDPYAGLGFSRQVAKRWVLEAFGKGRPPRRWSRGHQQLQDLRRLEPGAVTAAMLARYPFLASLDWLVPPDLPGAMRYPTRALVVHVLTWLEAEAMTLAMRRLRESGVLALPVHDSLIVPVWASDLARAAISAGYRQVCGLEPLLACR